MDATLTARAEPLARQMATSAGTVDDLNAMMTSALERMRAAERDHHLAASRVAVVPSTEAGDSVPPPTRPNRRDGRSPTTVPGDLGPIPRDTPRDRDGPFEPQLLPEHPRRRTGFDDTILALDAKGMTTRDIQDLVREPYGVDVPPTLVSQVTADLEHEVPAWRTRRRDGVWPIVCRDGLVVHVRGGDGRVSAHTLCVAVGVNLQGKMERLGLWLGETEGAKFWLSCLADRTNRGVSDLLIARVDGRTGFPEAIRTADPPAKVPSRLVRLVRAALKDVTDTDSRPVAADVKASRTSATVLEAEQALAKFAEVWGDKDPTSVTPWRLKWADLTALFAFPAPIRKAMSTTNAIESVNRVVRKFTRNRKQDPTAESALKLVDLAIHEASKTWTMPIVGWKAARNHFAIVFEGRIPPNAMGGRQHPGHKTVYRPDVGLLARGAAPGRRGGGDADGRGVVPSAQARGRDGGAGGGAGVGRGPSSGGAGGASTVVGVRGEPGASDGRPDVPVERVDHRLGSGGGGVQAGGEPAVEGDGGAVE